MKHITASAIVLCMLSALVPTESTITYQYAIVLCTLSALVPTESTITYQYDYDNFELLFPQSPSSQDDFTLHKYEEIDAIFTTKYVGPNIGGAFQLEGSSDRKKEFEGYIVDVTMSWYCAGNEAEDNDMQISVTFVDGFQEIYYGMCEGYQGWYYNTTFTPSIYKPSEKFTLEVHASKASFSGAMGFDEIKVRTTDEPSHLLQRHNN